MNKPTEIITHHSNGTTKNSCTSTQGHTVYIVDDWHRTLWPGFTSTYFKTPNGDYYHCGYHFVIWRNGDVWTWTQTRAIDEEGAHCLTRNSSSVGVLIMGNYDACSGDTLPDEAKKVWLDVYKEIQSQMRGKFGYELHRIVPHRTYSTKSCHGNTLSDDYYKKLILEEAPIDYAARIKELESRVGILEKFMRILQELFGKAAVGVTGERQKF